MEDLICHSGMLIGSILSSAFVVALVGGLGVLVAWVVRSTRRPTTSG